MFYWVRNGTALSPKEAQALAKFVRKQTDERSISLKMQSEGKVAVGTACKGFGLS
jgi:hypothetical protein